MCRWENSPYCLILRPSICLPWPSFILRHIVVFLSLFSSLSQKTWAHLCETQKMQASVSKMSPKRIQRILLSRPSVLMRRPSWTRSPEQIPSIGKDSYFKESPWWAPKSLTSTEFITTHKNIPSLTANYTFMIHCTEPHTGKHCILELWPKQDLKKTHNNKISPEPLCFTI